MSRPQQTTPQLLFSLWIKALRSSQSRRACRPLHTSLMSNVFFLCFHFFTPAPFPEFSSGYNNICISELGHAHSRRADTEKARFFCRDAGAVFSSRVQSKGNRISWCFRVRALLKKVKVKSPRNGKVKQWLSLHTRVNSSHPWAAPRALFLFNT